MISHFRWRAFDDGGKEVDIAVGIVPFVVVLLACVTGEGGGSVYEWHRLLVSSNELPFGSLSGCPLLRPTCDLKFETSTSAMHEGPNGDQVEAVQLLSLVLSTSPCRHSRNG